MAERSKWFMFWVVCGSFLAGILAVCGPVSGVNWDGSDKFCGTFCHTMNGVAYAWKQGAHGRNPSGVTAGCSDCHLYNASEPVLGPLGYISLLGHKVVAASHSGFGQVIGRFDTPMTWLQQRPEVEQQEIGWFKGNNFHTCRGCHDLSLMYDKTNPSIGAWHALYKDQTLDCLSCHKDVGHDYKQVDEYIKTNNAYPPLDEAWVFPVSASTSASPMPPQNLTPEQLKKDAQPWTPNSTSAASSNQQPNVNQSQDVQKIAKELYEKTKEGFNAKQPQAPAPVPAATSSASTAPKTQTAAPAPAPASKPSAAPVPASKPAPAATSAASQQPTAKK